MEQDYHTHIASHIHESFHIRQGFHIVFRIPAAACAAEVSLHPVGAFTLYHSERKLYAEEKMAVDWSARSDVSFGRGSVVHIYQQPVS